MSMDWNQIATVVLTGVMGLLGGGAFWGYWKDRKKSRAEGSVAVQTVELQIDSHRMQNLEQRFDLANKAWDEERESFQRRIEHLEQDLATARLELEKKESKILELEGKVQSIQRDLLDVTRELAGMRQTS
jgi:chromosome segregation ATPase